MGEGSITKQELFIIKKAFHPLNKLLLNETKRYKKHDWIDDKECFENKKYSI